MKKFAAMLVVLAVMILPVLSADNTDKDKEKRYNDIKKMLDASQATKMFEQMKDSIKENAGKMTQDLLSEMGLDMKDKDLEMTDEVKKLNQEYMSKSFDLSMKIINIEELMNDMIPFYDKYLSNEDIKAITVFYESPVGKRLLEATPKISMDSMPKLMEKMGANMKKIQAETEKNAKELAEKIKAIKEKQKKAKETKEKK